jgi:membrane glycosyltransferase
MDSVVRPGCGEAPVAELRYLPPSAPLAMRTQNFKVHGQGSGRLATSPAWIGPRRALVLGASTALALGACYEMYLVLEVGGLTIAEAILLAIFASLVAWTALSFVSALCGFIFLLSAGRDALGIDVSEPLQPRRTKTAMLLPIYNEDLQSTLQRLVATYGSVRELGARAQFDWFILSDSTSPEIWLNEERAFLDLRHMLGASEIYYRHRIKNEGRKSGNIAEWVTTFGAAYDHMMVLDADSSMTGDTICRLVMAMEQHPSVGLIQTVPAIINAQTVFGWAQQFASAIYGRMVAAGLCWWHGAEGNYWGHNAIIRTRAFAEQAGLPELPGRKPFGGHILSHDFVEAALVRRGGWAVHMTVALDGSFEECPPSLIEYAGRDRRWCQGNLQHLRVLNARGLHWMSRLHLLMGIGSYITAPLWLAFLLTGLVISLEAQFIRPEYFPKGFALFPTWPAQDPVRAMWVFGGTLALLIVPKLLGLLLFAVRHDRPINAPVDGIGRCFAVLFAEVLISGLLAPVMMVFQTKAVFETLSGRDSGWQAQRRSQHDAQAVPINPYIPATAMGAVFAGAAASISLSLLAWMSPVIIGLLLAVPLEWLTSRGLGAAYQTKQAAIEKQRTLADLLTDCELCNTHLANLPQDNSRPRGRINPILVVAQAKLDEAESLQEALDVLDDAERYTVLSDSRAFQKLTSLP